MRHRRRYQTQTLQRKNTVSIKRTTLPSTQPSQGWRKFFKFVLVVGILGAAVYYGYQYGVPVVEGLAKKWKQPSLQSPASANKPPTQDAAQKPVEDARETLEPIFPVQTRVQVEVLNGCGEKGIAKALSILLRKHNYDVVNQGNYLEKGKEKFDVPNTKIIDQMNTDKNITRARDLAELIGIDPRFIESFENSSPIADLTIIIGKDFHNLSIFQKKN